MTQIRVHQTPIIIADEAPEMSAGLQDLWEHTLTGESFYRWFCTIDNSWYTYNGVAWDRVGDGSINTETGFSIGGDEGATGTVRMTRDGGGTIELTIKGGIITEIEDEAE